MPNAFLLERNRVYTQRIRACLNELPSFCAAFFRSVENSTTVLTRYAYAIDLGGFFAYLVEKTDEFLGRDLPSLTLADLDRVTAVHIELYLEQMTLYVRDERERMNNERAKARKLSTLRSLFKYFFKQELIHANVAALVDAPKLHEKAIIRLEPNEVADLLDLTENGAGLTDQQKRYHEATRVRDVAILTLFLGTGIRISELVGLNVEDIDFESDAFVVTRKGGAEDILNFGDEVRQALLAYAAQREQVLPMAGHERALFLSLQKKRITARAVENLVKKYARLASPLKRITPHKLRSTYGTMLYHETQDIYLVADVLGHKDVNTTRKHYAAPSEEHKRIAAKKIRLRDE